MIALNHYLVLAAILFVIGIFGVFLNKKNIILNSRNSKTNKNNNR